jgi:hypothetical protein
MLGKCTLMYWHDFLAVENFRQGPFIVIANKYVLEILTFKIARVPDIDPRPQHL